MRIETAISGLVLLLPAAVTGRAYGQQSCDSLTGLVLDRASVTSASAVAASDKALKHCEVKGVARPTSDSEINFELWLPPAEAWSGKYLQVGNGGWAGSINSGGLAGPLLQGYATAATDDGHRAGGDNASFATGHPEKLIDFGYRALHETSRHSRSIIRAYYGKDANLAYFAGCSDGGREALMEAQRYPEDFKGIIAGAPANYWTHHFAGFIWNEKALRENPASNIPAAKLPLIQKAALAACDALDGVKDGLIEDPRKCHFDPSVLKCSNGDRPDCLTGPQFDALRKIYDGPRSAQTGEQIYPGYEAGTESEWAFWIIGGFQFRFGNGLFGDVVYENPKWDWHSFDLDRDLKLADEKVAPILNSYSPDLRSFRANGGKLIQYHGWGDPAIAPRDSIQYYEKVQAFLKQYPDPRSGNASKPIQDFYRLFMVPGMGHCSGGSGPVSFGNASLPGAPPIPHDADHDMVRALDRWVTQGIAPEQIIGTGRTAERVLLTRPLCVYPQVARYKGHGDTNAATSFACVEDPSK